jgi:hypothetical protein
MLLLLEGRMKIGFLPLFVTIAPAVLWPQSAYRPDIPKTWDAAIDSGDVDEMLSAAEMIRRKLIDFSEYGVGWRRPLER